MILYLIYYYFGIEIPWAQKGESMGPSVTLDVTGKGPQIPHQLIAFKF